MHDSKTTKTVKRRGTKKQLLIDRKILDLISQTGGRLSYRTLAKMLDLPHSTVYDHISFLVSKRLLSPSWHCSTNSRPENDLTNQDFDPSILLSKLKQNQ